MIAAQAHFIGDEERRLLGVVNGDPTTATALMVVCAPLLHEHFLGYRLLAAVCQHLASRGWATLRFDYFGSGDSGGRDEEFSLAGAAADTRCAVNWMRQRGSAPLLLAGVRGGAWPATACADTADRLLLWQPLANGAAWLEQLLKGDLAERSDRLRYPLVRNLPKPADDDWLLGSACPPELREELLLADWPRAPSIPVDLAATADSTLTQRWTYARRITLAADVGAWVDKVDMQNRSVFGEEFWIAADWVGDSFKASA